jgi:hypothetical protein
MGMVVGLTSIADQTAERILSDPPLVWKVVAPEDPTLYAEALAATTRPSLLARLTGRTPAPPPAHDLTLHAPEGVSIDLDKSWHGIHYLLTGTPDESEAPLSFLLSGGRAVGDVEVGYCPARVFNAVETRSIFAGVDAVTNDELRARFDPAAMMRLEIYPGIWDRYPASSEPLDYLLEYTATVRGFLRQAVAGGVGMVVTLT